MSRKKMVVLAIDKNKKIKETKVNPQLNLDSTSPTNKKSLKKIVLSIFAIGAGAYLYFNQEIIHDLINKTTNSQNISFDMFNKQDNETKLDTSSMPIVNTNTNNPSQDKQERLINNELAEAVKAKEQANAIAEELPTVSIADKQIAQQDTVQKPDEVPQVNINKNSTNESITPPPGNTISNDDLLQKELELLLRNSNFSINTKKDSLSLFINNINYNVGEPILNNNKFKLKDIKMSCENNKLPSFSFSIVNAQNDNILYSKQLKYSDSKKIVLSFDSLSVTDLGSNIENIYLPGELIFKDFKLDNIDENGALLNFKFSCSNNNITISGAELSAIE